MVLMVDRSCDMEETMPQTVPSAGFTPPCDYSNFAENFDLSLLPGGEQPLSPSTPLYPQQQQNPKILTTFYPSSPSSQQPDFQTLLSDKLLFKVEPSIDKQSPIYLEVPQQQNPFSSNLSSPTESFGCYRQSNEANFYPSSPELSLYTSSSPNSIYSRSPCGDEHFRRIKEENYLSPSCGGFSSSPISPANSYSNVSSPELVQTDVIDLLENTTLEIKQESTVDFDAILGNFEIKEEKKQPKDHQLLRQVLRDTSFQKKFNIKSFDFDFLHDIKMEEPEDNQNELMREKIEPVLNLAIEQMRKDVDNTCAALGISPDPSQWTPANVLSWLQWTSRQFGLSDLNPDQWDMSGSKLTMLSEEDFIRRSPQGGMILHAQLEIWKAAYSEENLAMNWLPETTSSNASSGDVSDDEEESASMSPDPARPSTSTSRTGGTHIHLWQFLKELLASPQTHGSCIRWLDRSKGIFKIEDSVKVARLWGKRKNRPAMNYDKLSRSIRQYYKKGIMKKTERSQRLVYQFCHPYNL